jgi:hypothetical protein
MYAYLCVSLRSESEKAWRGDKGDKVDRRRVKSCVMQRYVRTVEAASESGCKDTRSSEVRC